MTQMVNVVKKTAFLMMTMALAVAMAACPAATPTPGDKGDPGTPGERGPQGEPGTSDNNPPMQVKDLPMAYVALGGNGATPDKMTEAIDLSKYFEDAETPALAYTFESSDKDVAAATLETGSDRKMVVEGKKAGMVMITVKVWDGVNDPLESTFDVMVVANNARPVIEQLAAADITKLGTKLYISRGAQTITVTSPVYAGVAGEDGAIVDEVTFSADMGAAGDGDDVVKVSVEEGSKPNEWDITLTPLRSGLQNVRVTVTDKFGAKANADIGAGSDEADANENRWAFEVYVNTPPKLAVMLEDMVLNVGTTPAPTVEIRDHFDVNEKAPIAGPLQIDDTPDNLTDEIALLAAPTARETGATDQARDTTCSWSTSKGAGGDVDLGEAGASGNNPSITIPIAATDVGTYQLTIACRDPETIVSDTATITVRPETS